MIHLRAPVPDELQEATLLCLRSKAYWGYDEEFMRQCVDELTLEPEELGSTAITLAMDGDRMLGVAQVSNDEQSCCLEKLFVDINAMGMGVGRILFDWAIEAARELGANELVIEADPDAVPFYRKMGCEDAGWAPSGSIPGRKLPRLVKPI